MLYRRFFIVIGMLLGLTMAADGATKRFTLVIDAGHGGVDAGAMGKRSMEKTLTLRYALAFGRVIEKNCPDVKVVYTRKTDCSLKLWQRTDIANTNKADLFVSVHINALPKGRISRGYQTYTLGRSRRDGNTHGFEENLEVAKRENSVILYEEDYQEHYEGFDPNSPESNIMFELMQDKNMENSIALAKFMQRHICAATGRQDKGVHQDNLAVLRKASMPACLLELGFISTPDEEEFLNSDEALNRFTQGFYNAFVAYKNQVAPDKRMKYKPEPVTVLPENAANNSSSQAADSLSVQKKKDGKEKGKTGQPAAIDLPAREKQAVPDSSSAPVFKVQFLTSGTKLKAGNRLLKGVTDFDFYQEGNVYKYTVGASDSYQEIYQLRKEISAKFPEAFIVAFKEGKKMNVSEAIQEYKANNRN